VSGGGGAKNIEEKVVAVFDRQFALALQQKEEELATIDERILEVRRLMEVVRRGSVNNYYAPTQTPQSVTRPGVSFHPAIKREFVGKRPRVEPDTVDDLLEVKKEQEENDNKDLKIEDQEKVQEIEKDNIDGKHFEEIAKPRYVEPRKAETPYDVPVPRGSGISRFKQELVVGNVSKWLEEEEREGMATHKWMLYVRGGKHNPDISAVVSRVEVELHPSYSPHHLVEISTPPFHLTRRGWGEFPLKLKIHFHHPEDRPLSMEHQLKLDKTCRAEQTLGAESCLEVWLHREKKADDRSAEELFEEDRDLGGWVIRHTSEDSLRPPLIEAKTGDDEEMKSIVVETTEVQMQS